MHPKAPALHNYRRRAYGRGVAVRGFGMEISSVGVVGAGQMGNGIAHVMAVAGFDVLLNDISQDVLEDGVKLIEKNMARQSARGKLAKDQIPPALARITTTVNLADLGATDLIIESATERETVKQAIFEDLLPHLQPHTILTSNTSSISITRLASRTDRPERFMGFHFMNPVPVMQLVEVIRGLATSDATTTRVMETARALGKTPVEVNDYPGFVSNRVLMPMINEAVYCVMEGVAQPEAVDTVMKLGMNHPLGPLALADLIGLDVCLAILEVLHRGLGDDKYRPCPLLRKMVAAGRLGRKRGRGFYDYTK